MTHEQELAELLTLTVKVNRFGDVIYCNHLGEYHRVHGPALIKASGHRFWYYNGLLHRTDGAAIEWAYGDREWWLNGTQCTQQSHRYKTSHCVKIVL